MALDPTIALQTKQADPTTMISSFLDLGRKKLELDRSKETYDADVARSKAVSSSAQSGATVDAANVNPLIQQQAANTQSAQTAAASSRFHLQGEQAQMGRQIAGSFVQDPDFIKGNTDGMIDKISQARQQMIQSGVPAALAEANTAQLISQAVNEPAKVLQSLKNIILQGQTSQGQSGTVQPGGIGVTNNQQSTVVNTNPFAGQQVGASIPGTTRDMRIAPGQQDTQGSDQVGNPYVTRRDAFGNIIGANGLPGASTTGAGGGPVALPPNETPQTRETLQGERSAAQQATLTAPAAHQLNREIVSLTRDPDLLTNSLGKYIRDLQGKVGYQGEGATKLDTLGKLLERSALNAAQGMGPHTNAGLESSIRANGTTAYTPETIRNIANLNDALTTGQQMYQQGLENAIAKSGNGVFAKRQFDQQWSSAMDPDVLKFKNAVDNGDNTEAQFLIKQAGGKGSKGAQTLIDKLGRLINLSGQ